MFLKEKLTKILNLTVRWFLHIVSKISSRNLCHQITYWENSSPIPAVSNIRLMGWIQPAGTFYLVPMKTGLSQHHRPSAVFHCRVEKFINRNSDAGRAQLSVRPFTSVTKEVALLKGHDNLAILKPVHIPYYSRCININCQEDPAKHPCQESFMLPASCCFLSAVGCADVMTVLQWAILEDIVCKPPPLPHHYMMSKHALLCFTMEVVHIMIDW